MTSASPSPDPSHRARDEGKAWAARRIAALSAAGRAISGGWPGTLSEAKHLAALHVCPSFPPVDAAGRERLSQTLYVSAKRHWLAHSTRDNQEF